MASQLEEILGKQINSIKALKAEIKSLQDSLVGLDAESQEFKDTAEKLIAAQDEYNKVTKVGKQESDAATDSIRGMELEYKNLYDTYKKLSEEQRKSDFGKNMAKSLDELSTKLNSTKMDVGNFTSNIGNYTNSAMDAFKKMGQAVQGLNSPLKMAGGGVKALGQSLKALIANPVGLAIMGIVVALKALQNAFKNNEEAQKKLKEAMDAFKPVMDVINKALVEFVEITSKAIKWVGDFTTKLFGLKKNAESAADAIKRVNTEEEKLKVSYAELDKYDASRARRIRDLEEQAAETKNVQEATELLTEAKRLQEIIDENQILKARNTVEDLKLEKFLKDDDTESTIALINAEAKLEEVRDKAAQNTKKYDERIQNLAKTMRNAASSTTNYREEAKKLYEQLIENNKDEITKVTEKYVKEKALLEKYNYDTKLLTKKYNEDIAKIIADNNEKEWKKHLEVLKQRRAELQANLDAERTYGYSSLADSFESGEIEKKVIPALEAISDKVNAVLAELFKTGGEEAAKAFSKGITDKGFASLGDEYNDLKHAVDEVNASYSLSITTLGNLNTTLETLAGKSAELAGKSSLAKISEYEAEKMVHNYKWAFDQLTKNGDFGFVSEEMLRKEYESLDHQKVLLEERISIFQGTRDQELEILKKYYAVVEEMETRHQELTELNQQRTQEMVDNLASAMDTIGSSLGTVKSSYESLIDSEVKAGNIDEKQAKEKKKRLEKLEIAQQAFAIATIAADAASGLFTIWKGYATETGVINAQTAAAAGPAAAAVKGALDAKSLVSAIAKTTSLAATATAQIMAAKNGIVTAVNNMNADDGGSVGVAATPMVIDSAPYEYARTVQTEEDEEYLNQRPYFVKVSDILDGINTHNVQVTESSF